MELNYVAQFELEEKYDRKKVKAKVKDSILSGFYAQVYDGIEAVYEYMRGDYYTVKSVRVGRLDEADIESIVLEIYAAVLPVQGRQTIQTVVGMLVGLMPHEVQRDKIITAAELIAVVCTTDVYDIVPSWSSDTGGLLVESCYTLPDDLLDYIADTKYLPPMLCKPRELVKNNDSGYLTKKEPVILGGKLNYHTKKLGLDVLNIQNGIELELDLDMLALEEGANKELDTKDKRVQFERHQRASREVYDLIVLEGNSFYLTWGFDKRGRVYSRGHHINIQGTDYKKSLISLKNKSIIPLD